MKPERPCLTAICRDHINDEPTGFELTQSLFNRGCHLADFINRNKIQEKPDGVLMGTGCQDAPGF